MAKSKVAAIAGIVVVLLLGLSLWLNLRLYRTNRQQASRIEVLGTNTSSGNAVIEQRYVDRDSASHAVVKDVPVRTVAEKTLAVGKGYTDTVVTALKVALDQISELTKVKAQLEAAIKLQNASVSGTVDTPGVSPVKTYSDRYLSLVYRPDNDSLSLSYTVALNQASYWKRSWLLAPKKYYVDLWSDDPRVNINNVKRFTTDFPQSGKRFGLGISAGYGYSPVLNRAFPYAGVSLNYNLLEF